MTLKLRMTPQQAAKVKRIIMAELQNGRIISTPEIRRMTGINRDDSRKLCNALVTTGDIVRSSTSRPIHYALPESEDNLPTGPANSVFTWRGPK